MELIFELDHWKIRVTNEDVHGDNGFVRVHVLKLSNEIPITKGDECREKCCNEIELTKFNLDWDDVDTIRTASRAIIAASGQD